MKRFVTKQSPGILIVTERLEEPEYKHTSNEAISGPEWKLAVGAMCNLLLTAAEDLTERGGRTDIDPRLLADAIHSLVERVAEFEELDKEP